MTASADIALRDPERFATLAFLSIRGVGTATCSDLQEKFGSLAAALEAGPERYLEGLKSSVREAHASQSPREGAERIAVWCERNRVQMIFRGDPDWPVRLDDLGRETPQLIFVRGQLDPAPRTAGVVGTREPTPEGREMARALGEEFAKHGVVTVSGGAFGIDSASHEGALTGGGSTWAVLAAGLANLYPSQNVGLFARIAERGALITEFPHYIENNDGFFIRRNKLIAALSEALVYVEGDLDSGARHTVADTLTLKRPLFGVVGPLRAEKSRGPNAVLRAGKATVCMHPSDVLFRLGVVAELAGLGTTTPSYEAVEAQPTEAPLDASLEPALQALGRSPRPLDDLVVAVGWPAPQLLAALTQLELLGLCEQRPGKLFVRRVG